MALFRTSFRALATTDDSSYRLKQVQIIHRHGDRTPITPLKDEAYWSQLLISPNILQKIAQGTTVQREKITTHVAGGRGPFGQLTSLGLLQMVQVGMNLRERYVDSNVLCDSLQATDLLVFSTDFPRTIQSVQGLLSGLFPDGLDTDITIDVRPSSWMIPDPMPRFTKEQEILEQQLARTPTVIERETALRPLALRVTQALHEFLADDAHDAAFGVEGEHPGEVSIEIQPLAWVQLAEITKCLAVRSLLPSSITKLDQEQIAAHAAWRWFQTLSHPRMAYLGMHRLVQQQLQLMTCAAETSPMIVWSGHDSSLIGLLCAYRLERPSTWPEYASYLCLELLETKAGEQYIRFSLNGEVLKSQWEDDDELWDKIPLEMLQQKVSTMGADTQSESITTD
ncbi:acid phosphatase [Fistulifera solaris]|uniref:Acid phosphatase n=1 Tax=Fistulifera solaris TaxID=1519565 RepID=A0A1Z5JRD8_FISSO|nr:acid phosphatase [Fistulifera solaris]|eukprot:GAX16529.1 acid phosphatase [Fistulifera solaris]